MAQNLQDLFNNSRQYLHEIIEKTNQFREDYPEMFSDSELLQSFTAFQNEYADSQERLEKPTLSIAMLGTTSAGKSTIVNALIGRRIAPIEASEMSGGILKIEYDIAHSLTVNKTEGAKWEVGTWNDLTDEDVYKKIKALMTNYHKVRKESLDSLAAPDVLVKGPILPYVEKSLLGLSDIFEIEFIDLPGLKSVKDETNLKVIQSRVSKSFCLVALDYLQTDNDNRANLLKELKQVVEYLAGKTDSMIFLLNRVDARGYDDQPLEDRINILRREIRGTLNLDIDPEILPFSARLLYYAQCAWGAAPFNGEPSASQETQFDLVRAIFRDCASILEEKYEDDPDLEDWFREFRRNIRNDTSKIDIESLRKILFYALEWSGGRQLWERLKDRLTTSFPEIVLLPALFKFLQTHKTLFEQLQSVVETRKVNTVKKAKEELEKIDNVAVSLIAKVEKNGKLFLQNLEDAVNKLQQPDWKAAVGSLKELGEGFANLDETISNIEIDLINDIIFPISGFLQDCTQPRDDLEEILSKVIVEPLAKEVARSYDGYSRKFLELQAKYSLRQKSDVWELKISASDPNADEVFESVERVTKQLFDSVRDALQSRASFLIQAKASELGNAVSSIVEEQKTEYKSFCEISAPSFGFISTVFAKLETSVSGEKLKLPDNLFRLPGYPEIQRMTETKTRYETRTTIEKRRRWFVLWLAEVDTEITKQVPVVDKYHYKTVQLPNSEAIAAEWEDGIYDAEAEMWSALSDWVKDILRNLSASFSGAVASTQLLIERSLNEQIDMIKTESVMTENRLRGIEYEILDISKTREKLMRSTRST